MQLALAGDTVAQLEILFNTGLATLAATATAGAVGFIAGLLMCGAIYDRINKEMSFVAFHFIVSVTVTAAPFTSLEHGGGLPAFTAMVFVRGFGNGFISAG